MGSKNYRDKHQEKYPQKNAYKNDILIQNKVEKVPTKPDPVVIDHNNVVVYKVPDPMVDNHKEMREAITMDMLYQYGAEMGSYEDSQCSF